MLLPILSDQTVDWLLPPTLAKWLPNLRAGVEVPRVSGTISAPVIQTSALVMQPSRHPHLLLQLPYRDNRAGLWYYSSLLHGRLLNHITQKYFPSQKNISRLKKYISRLRNISLDIKIISWVKRNVCRLVRTIFLPKKIFTPATLTII